MKIFYLAATIVGAAVPLYFFSGFFAAHGFGLSTFFAASFANPAAAGLVSDLFLSAFIAFAFIARDARKLGIHKVWLVVLGTCLIGLSFGLPLYLYWREGALEKSSCAPLEREAAELKI